jgi:hypothetical protein
VCAALILYASLAYLCLYFILGCMKTGSANVEGGGGLSKFVRGEEEKMAAEF